VTPFTVLDAPCNLGLRAPRNANPGPVFVTHPDGLGRVDEEADHVDLAQRREGAAVGALAQQRARLVDPGRVEEHDLRVLVGANAAHLRARRLRAVGDDRDLAADELVQERGLADVGSPDEDDRGAASGAFHSHRESNLGPTLTA